jgi:phenylalanyl-tRNA synthetase beta chain
VIEEIARIHGYDNIPETRIQDELPPQLGNPLLDKEERVRDLLVLQGLQEIISYRFTTPEREARCLPQESPADDKPYVHLANPLSAERAFMRHTLLAGMLENASFNARTRQRLAIFEIGPVFFSSESGELPDEMQRLSILLAGPRGLPSWQGSDQNPMDFFDLKGMLDDILDSLHVPDIHYETGTHPSFHPGKCARLLSNEQQLGVIGEIHPKVWERYDWPVAFSGIPLLVADLDLDALLALVPERHDSQPVPEFPPVLEDLALVVDEGIPAGKVADVIQQTGGKIVAAVQLFDVYRGDKVGAGKKSLAYSITYQASGKTLSDKDVAGIRTRILRRLEQELGVTLRQ